MPSVQSELAQNVLSPYYSEPFFKKVSKNEKRVSYMQCEFQKYTHQDAIDFAEHSLEQMSNSFERHPVRPRNKDHVIKEGLSQNFIRAYYRVVVEKPDSYILSACHVNVHGYHRGDLRFIEVNDRTRCIDDFSVIGKLYLGDIIVVYELAKLREFQTLDARKVSTDSDTIWMAEDITVLNRFVREVTFSILNTADGTAVVKDHHDLMKVTHKNLEPNRLYHGKAFVPEKIKHYFTGGHSDDKWNHLINKCSKINQPSNPQGTIFEVSTSKALEEIFKIGQNAFKKPSLHGNTPTEIVEECVLMGYAAANAMAYGRIDTRDFPMWNVVRYDRILEFTIDNPFKDPTEGKWEAGTKIEIKGGSQMKDSAVIETAIADKGQLKISARLCKGVPRHIRFTKGLHIVSQQEPYDLQHLRDGFFKEIPDGSNGRRILMTLYGGSPIPKRLVAIGNYYYQTEDVVIKLNQYQAEYVEMIKDPSNPIIIGSSPFGCGKSMTIVTAALEISKTYSKIKQLLVTQSNFASVNLVEIARKIKNGFKFVRYISESNSKLVAEDCLTDFDLPVLMKKVFTEWALGGYQLESRQLLDEKRKTNMLNFLLNGHCVEPHELVGEARTHYNGLKKSKHPSPFFLHDAFFHLYSPQVIMTTADSLTCFLERNFEEFSKHAIATIQIDEASQLPEHTFISLLTRFPKANYGLIGDIKQLPPYCETGLEGKLKDYGIGNTMERAVAGNLFPQAMLREVYRCHPRTTMLLSGFFYEGKLVPGVKEQDRNEFMQKRPDFWPNPNFPIMVVDNQEKGKRMGTSRGNTMEKELVKQILNVLTTGYNGYRINESDIGIISFYKAQTSVLTDALRGRGVKCGTVDSFQGSEKEVIILCCTNEVITDFMQIGNRLNVALSRAKQATIIIGNVAGLKQAVYWGTIVKEAEKNGCVVNTCNIGKIQLNSQSAPTRPQVACGNTAGRSKLARRNSSFSFVDDCSSDSDLVQGLAEIGLDDDDDDGLSEFDYRDNCYYDDEHLSFWDD